MENVIKAGLEKLAPDILQGKHQLQFGKVTEIPDPPVDGDVSTAFVPKYAVHVEMLDRDMQPTGVIYPDVWLPMPSAGAMRGVMGFPAVGTVVSIMFAYGDPEHPVITNVYPVDLALPALLPTETLIQHSAHTFLRSNEDEDWLLQAKNKLWLGNDAVNIVAELRALAELVRDHTHPKTATPLTAAAMDSVASRVKSIEK
jgi:hypothetical protein